MSSNREETNLYPALPIPSAERLFNHRLVLPKMYKQILNGIPFDFGAGLGLGEVQSRKSLLDLSIKALRGEGPRRAHRALVLAKGSELLSDNTY